MDSRGWAAPYQLMVRDEYDIVTLRQEVRQMARELALSLTRQARVTAGVTGLARALLQTHPALRLTIRMAGEGARPALELRYGLPGSRASRGQLEALLQSAEAQWLADEASISTTIEEAQIVVRMWLA